MHWFRTYTNEGDTVRDQVLAQLGLDGCERLTILQKIIVSAMDTKDVDPAVTYSLSTWLKKLHLNRRSWPTFVDCLQTVSETQFIVEGQSVTIRMPMLQDLLDKRSTSGRVRACSRGPRTDKNRVEQSVVVVDDDASPLNGGWEGAPQAGKGRPA